VMVMTALASSLLQHDRSIFRNVVLRANAKFLIIINVMFK
jgi:hypothetical protein